MIRLKRIVQTKTVAGAMLVLLVLLRVASPYLHSHEPLTHAASELTSSNCAACEIESTTISNDVDPVALPARRVERVAHAVPTGPETPFTPTLPAFDLRGPPITTV